MLPNQLEIPCQAVDISPGGAGLISAHVPQLGDHAIIYLDHVGRIEGENGATLQRRVLYSDRLFIA